MALVPLAIAMFSSILASPVYAWQLGWSTTDSSAQKGINATYYNDQVFLQGNIGILEGFTDNNNYWINIGVGIQTQGSGCANPPVLWEEVVNPSGIVVAHYSLGCLTYGSTEQLSIIYDSRTGYNRWGWFFSQGELSTYNTGGSKIGNYGHVNMIESSTTTCRSPTSFGYYFGCTIPATGLIGI